MQTQHAETTIWFDPETNLSFVIELGICLPAGKLGWPEVNRYIRGLDRTKSELD